MKKLLAIVVGTLSLSGCVTAARFGSAGAMNFVETSIPGYSNQIRYVEPDHPAFTDWLEKRFARARLAVGDGQTNLLALSGGGAGGAYGAGLLKGLSEGGSRPTFAMVTGVSTGALIAPFAFLGSDWDDELEKAFTDGGSESLVKSAGISSLFRVGILKGDNLRNLVSEFITPELIRAVAEESAKGRILLVATTNLDAEAPVYWDMGLIASRGGEEARQLFIDVLVASASIPGAFPPVMIPVETTAGSHDEMHVDGGVTVPFFLFPEVAFLSNERYTGLNAARVYVVVNGQLDPVQQTSKANTIVISLRSSNVALMRMTWTELMLASAFASRQGMELKFTAIPTSYDFSGPFNFEKDGMRKLYDFAQKCAASGHIWLTNADVLNRLEKKGLNPTGPTCPAS